MPLVSCISVTYGPTPEIFSLLESVQRHAGDISYDMTVVAQPSDDGSMAEEISRRAPWVRVIALDSNIGFGPANNLSIDQAAGDFIALLNPDIVVTEGWLSPLLSALDDRAVFVAAPPLLSAEGRVDEAGQVMFADGGSDAIGGAQWPNDYEQMMFSRDVDYASAACWLMRRSVFLELGGFDPAYAPAYFEDPDLAFTARARGLLSRLVVDRPVVHAHAVASESRVALAERSRKIFQAKWTAVLKSQPTRLKSGEDGARVRDHMCASRTLILIGDSVVEAEVAAIVEKAGVTAAAHPRERVAVAVSPRPFVEGLRRRFSRMGLEIIQQAPLDVLASRREWATSVERHGV
jgi:GT2 family glycosyltransferase